MRWLDTSSVAHIQLQRLVSAVNLQTHDIRPYTKDCVKLPLVYAVNQRATKHVAPWDEPPLVVQLVSSFHIDSAMLIVQVVVAWFVQGSSLGIADRE